MVDALFISCQATDKWWQYLADNYPQSSKVVSFTRGQGSINLVDSFYYYLKKYDCEAKARAKYSNLQCEDIIRRCRVLRNLSQKRALSMIGAMHLTIEKLLITEKPKLVLGFIIDRYTFDIIDRLASDHNIKFVGLTASIMPNHIMLMDRGKLIKFRAPLKSEIDEAHKQVIHKDFVPIYARNSKKYSHWRFWKVFLRFKLRGLVFQLIRLIKRDRLNLHYLDALNYLEHKPRIGDYKTLSYFNLKWEEELNATDESKRVFLGLQLYPEASLDYWLNDLSLLENEEVNLEICTALSSANYKIFVKDHPLQFGFRKRGLMQKLLQIPNVVLVPYDAPASTLINSCPVTLTFTGTIGFESALVGNCSVVSNAYYADDKNFIHFSNFADIKKLPSMIDKFKSRKLDNIDVAKQLVADVLAASAPGDLFSFKNFNPKDDVHIKKIATLVDSLNRYLPQIT